MSAIAVETTTTVVTNTAPLLAAVKDALRAVSKRPTTPIMAFLHVSADAGALQVSGFDWETGVTRTIDASGFVAPFVVTGIAFRDALARLDQKQPVNIGWAGDRVTITQGTRTVNLKTGDVGEFPALPAVTSEAVLTTTGQHVAAMVAGVLPFVGKDDMLPALTGINLTLEGDTLYGEGTDRFRAAYTHHLVKAHVEKFEALVPNMATVAAVMGNEPHVTVHLDQGIIAFSSQTTLVTLRVLDGQFPKLRRLYPEDGAVNTVTEFEPVAFLSAVKFVEAGVPKNGTLAVTVSDGITGTAYLSSTNDDGDEHKDTVPADRGRRRDRDRVQPRVPHRRRQGVRQEPQRAHVAHHGHQARRVRVRLHPQPAGAPHAPQARLLRGHPMTEYDPKTEKRWTCEADYKGSIGTSEANAIAPTKEEAIRIWTEEGYTNIENVEQRIPRLGWTVVFGQLRWGAGTDLIAAKAQFRANGGVLSQGYHVAVFDDETDFLGFGGMGYFYFGNAPEVTEVAAKGGKR